MCACFEGSFLVVPSFYRSAVTFTFTFGCRVVVRVNFKTGRHRTAALKRARPRWGALSRLHDNWQEAS